MLARPGARVILEVEEGADPLQIERFDPINLFVLDDGEVVQANFITLAGARGSVALTNPGFTRNAFAGTVVLTVAAGRHPLADGIRRVTVVGLAEAPHVARGDETVTVTAPGLRIELRGAQLRADSEALRITVPRAGRSHLTAARSVTRSCQIPVPAS